MNKSKSMISKSTLVIFCAAVFAAVLLMSLLLIGTQTVAWFKTHLVVENPALISNYTTSVQYSYNNGTNWTTVEAGKPIPVDPETLQDLQIRMVYDTATHHAYARVSVYGSFYNAYTGTYLPQSADFWSFVQPTSDTWAIYGEHLYYTEKLTADTSTTAFQVKADWGSLDISDYQDYQGELYVVIDAVQPDRYPVFWPETATITTVSTA